MALEYKSVRFALKAADPAADDDWEIAGLASTWWGEPDAYGDVVQPGAFSASIAERPTKFLYEHHTPIGTQLELRETDEGLFGRWSVVDTQVGTDAYKLAKAGVLDSLSIGYIPLEWEIRGDGVRVLQVCDLYEVSAVALPANERAVITAVKRIPDPDPDPEPDPAPAPAAVDTDDPLAVDLEIIRRRLARLGIKELAS
jgi:HK97 family phage prohead protease